MRITLVFILSLVLPSVLLSAFAYQAVMAEQRARLADRSQLLRSEARNMARALDDLLATRARELAGAIAPIDADRLGAEDAAALARVTSQAAGAQFVRSVVIFDAGGRRIHPASPAAARPRHALRVGGSVGGLTGATLPVDALEVLAVADERAARDVDGALSLLRRLVRRGSPAEAAAARYDMARIHEASPTLAGVLSALEAYGALASMPLGLIDVRGRAVAAQGRLREALALHALQNRAGCAERLAALLHELEADDGAGLPAEAVAEVAERAGAMLEAEGLPTLARARALTARRVALEHAATRVEDVFGRSLPGALPGRAALGAGGPGLLASAGGEPGPAGADADAASATFLKARLADRWEVAACAPLRGRGGATVGLVVVQLDLDALERELRSRVRQRGAELLAAEGAAPAPAGAEGEAATETLRHPLDHVAVRVRSAPDAPAESDALDLPGRSVQVWAVALSVVGIAGGVLATLRTVRREAKAAQLKSDFVANVTHELKTPLTSIRMFLDTLLLGRVTDEAEAKECLQVMARESERLTRLIEKLLVFSRIESRKWRLKLGFVRPRELVQDALKILADQLGTTPDALGIEVVTVAEPPEVAVDRFAIVEAILNVLHNAWKYSAVRGAERKVRVVLTSRRRHVEVAVEDNGIGVPRGDRRRIFVKFERGSNAEEARIEGSGIGLTLALNICEAHGGTITYTPLKPGSRFSLFLPK